MPMMQKKRQVQHNEPTSQAVEAEAYDQPDLSMAPMTEFGQYSYRRSPVQNPVSFDLPSTIAQRKTPSNYSATTVANKTDAVNEGNDFPLQYSMRQPSGITQELQSSSMEAPLQLKVEKYKAGAWYSSFDPYTTFFTKAEATVYDRKLRNQGRESLRARVPTLYTYTHTKPTNKLSFALQGPHTVAHRLILQALIDAQTAADVYKIVDDQVLDPADAETVVFTDEAPLSGSFSSTLQPRLERYIDDYTEIYDAFLLEYNKPKPDLISLKHMANQLVNMDPYAVYAWKTTNKASSKSLSGKGESLVNPTFDDLYDKPPSSSFRNDDNLESFVDSRRQLFDDTF